jgi:hypothetical protein
MSMLRRARLIAAVGVVVLLPAANAGASAPTAAQKQAFPALRDAPATHVPATVRQFVTSSLGRKAGVDADSVRRVQAPNGRSWSVLPGDGQVCVVFEDHEGIASCAADAQAAASGVTALLITPSTVPGSSAVTGPAVQVGLAPASVASVDGRGPAEQVAPSGAFAVAADGLKPVTLRGVDGERTATSRRFSGTRPVGPLRAKAATLREYSFCNVAVGYYWCTISGSMVSTVEPFSSSLVQSADGNWLCGNMIESNGAWAGTTFCANSMTAVSHPWNSTNRRAWAGPGIAGVSVYGGSAAYWNE